MYTPRPDPPYMRRPLPSAQSAVLGTSSAANRLNARAEDKGSKLAEVKENDERCAQLTKEVAILQAKLVDRDAKLAAQTAKASLNVELERKLEHLVEKYKSSKLKNEQELASARKAQTAVQSEVDILRHQVKKGDAAAADAVKTLARVTREGTEARLHNEELKKKLQLGKPDVKLTEELAANLECAEEEVVRLRVERDQAVGGQKSLQQRLDAMAMELQEARLHRTLTPDRSDQEKQLVALGRAQSDNQDLRQQLESSQQKTSAIQALHDELVKELDSSIQELDTTQRLLQAAAVSYSTLHRNSVPRATHQRTQRELLHYRIAQVDLDAQVNLLRMEAAGVYEEMNDVKAALQEARDRAREAEEVAKQILEDRAAHVAPEVPDEDFDRGLLDIALERMQWDARLHREARKEAKHAMQALEEATQNRDTVLAALNDANSHLASEVGRRREDETRLSEAVAKRTEALSQLGVVEEAAKIDREGLVKAQESIARWKVAEAALEEEIEGLRNSLTIAMRFQEAYVELEGSYRALLSCQAETEDEAERLGQVNAELRGLGGSDRISYVETVRRDSAAVKQELAATRSLLNTAHERIATLCEEIESYKAVGSHDVPKRVRVTRRLPEDGRLSTSVLGKSLAK